MSIHKNIIYQIAPLDGDGQIIPCLMPYTLNYDPLAANRRIILVDDAVLAARGAKAAKERNAITQSTIRCFTEAGNKAPWRLPLSCAEMLVTAGAQGTPGRYEARYRITPLPYKPDTVCIKDPGSLFAEWLGQSFRVEYTPWPFGSQAERTNWITVRIAEELPFPDDSDEATEMSKEMCGAHFLRTWIRITGRSLRFAIAEVQGSRVRPQTATRSTEKTGRRR